tara:strand:- start:415 stop:795 length:381 start_codon:yes stop_codon:yes gene_type:complete
MLKMCGIVFASIFCFIMYVASAPTALSQCSGGCHDISAHIARIAYGEPWFGVDFANLQATTKTNAFGPGWGTSYPTGLTNAATYCPTGSLICPLANNASEADMNAGPGCGSPQFFPHKACNDEPWQ